MKRLAPDLFDRRFGDLMETARARLPGLAPDWTDHNAHDPGITLMELLAWVTEAQLYSLGRMRRDERAAYAALSGLAACGTVPARGLIWPDPHAPAAVDARSRVIAAGTAIKLLGAETPVFRPAARLLYVAGGMTRLSAVLKDDSLIDHTAINARGGRAFYPFGRAPGPCDVLRIDFACRDEDGLVLARRCDGAGALWPIGIRADVPLTGAGIASDTRFAAVAAPPSAAGLVATLVTPTRRFPVAIAADSSSGMLRTGVLLLDLCGVEGAPRTFTIELRAAHGFERAPRLLRIEPNVVPLVQGRQVSDEVHVATGDPDWSFQLDVPGLRFAAARPPVRSALREPHGWRHGDWQPASLADRGPLDTAFEFDPATQRVRFGNGVNGRIPPAGATMLASYAVSDGEQGSVAANRRWRIEGFEGTFGVNPDAVTGGAAPTTWLDERREARRRAQADHALVSADDIVAAARALPLLEVARAWVVPPGPRTPRTGVVTLVAMRARASPEDAPSEPETPRWLDGVRRRLAPAIPLATRLHVVAPVYIGFSFHATVEVAIGNDPATIQARIERELAARLALTGPGARRPGIPVGKNDVAAWLRCIDGVTGVMDLRLLSSGNVETDEIPVPRNGLPVLDRPASVLNVRRAGWGGAP